MSTEQQYYLMLSRTDHPVFRRDFSDSVDEDTPFNSVFNRLVAKQFIRFRTVLDEIALNSFILTATALGIDQWEETYFGFTKPSLPLATRKSEVLAKRNKRLSMSYPDALAISLAITGKTPLIHRNLVLDGWILDSGVLDYDTILCGVPNSGAEFVYEVIFFEEVDSDLLAQLDIELTKIEKAGCRHVIQAPQKIWILDDSSLDFDTILG